MTDRRYAMATEQSKPPWLGLVTFLWIVLFTVILYLLGVAMVRHHFLRGGQDNHNWRDSTGR